jgi:STE24 endopeptidase
VQQLTLFVAVLVIAGLVDLPFSLYRQFGLEARFGFNKMTWKLFVADLFKMVAISALFGVPLLAVVLTLMRVSGALWWFYAWLVWTGFNLLIHLLYPTLIAPIFNRFAPLEDAPLRERIEALLARCGFAAKGVFVMDGSRRSTHGNAYFTGFGASKRIVFFDTLLARLSPREIEAVLAHELGHFKRHHVIKRIGVSFALSFAGLALLGWLVEQPWFFAQLGVDPTLASKDAVALLLFFFVMPVFTFLIGPLFSLASRRHEFEADAFAAQHTAASELVHALVKLYEDNASTLTPDPLHSAFYDSHPPAALRIERLDAQLSARSA